MCVPVWSVASNTLSHHGLLYPWNTMDFSVHQASLSMSDYLNILSKYLKYLKGVMENNTIRVGDSTTSFSTMDTSPRQKISKKILRMNCTLNQMNLTDRYRTFHPIVSECTLFSTTN